LRNHLCNVSKNPLIDSIDTAYYTSEQFNQKFKKVGNGIALSILHINIRSLNSKYKELYQFIAHLDVQLDVLILSEVWTYNIDFYSNLFKGYDFYYNLPKYSHAGGVAMYIRREIFGKIRKDLYMCMKDDDQCENLWIKVVKG